VSGPILAEPVVYRLADDDPVTGPAPDGAEGHLARFGPLPGGAALGADRLLPVLHRLALTGRGGAHLAATVKWRAVLAAGGPAVVVGNGAEGEPASAKDAALLQHRPHLVLDGLAVAAAAVGADRVVLWLHQGAGRSRRAVERALAQRRGAAGEVAVAVVLGPDAYLSGESSAVVRALSGGPALPAFRRLPSARRGVAGRPTLLHNVETLARIALAARNGGADYRDATLVTVTASGRRTVLDVGPSTTVARAVERAIIAAGPAAEGGPEPAAVLLGGYGGTWLPWHEAARLPLRHGRLVAAGAGLGAGVIVPLPAGACGLAQTARLADYLAEAGARQCGPCRYGLRDIADLLLDLAHGDSSRRRLRRVHHFAAEITGRGGCHLPDGAIRMVLSALTVFAEDLQLHARRGRCRERADPFGGPELLPLPAGSGPA
jgi:NADH:ubiquinone oxidoreductase subunit F (NADH-binding)